MIAVVLSFIFGFGMYGIQEWILSPLILIPFAYAICGVKRGTVSPKEKLNLEQKFPFFLVKGILSIVMFVTWIQFAQEHTPEWKNFWNWHHFCEYIENTGSPEWNAIKPHYVFYFAYSIWVFFKDLLKDRKDAGIAQYLFDTHHLITIALVYYSGMGGFWRGAMLTRIMHDPADIVMYGTKTLEMIYKKRTGRESGCFLLFLCSCVVVSWLLTRILAYGVFCVQVTRMVMYVSEEVTLIMYALVVGSWTMFALQVVWQYAIFGMWHKHFKGEETSDPWHNQGKRKPELKKA